MQGFVTDDMSPHKTRSLTEHSCTFLGFCQLPGHPHVRRIDIKIYPRWYAPSSFHAEKHSILPEGSVSVLFF